MKKIKLLTPILGLTALSGTLIPLTSCGSTTEETLKIVPDDLFAINNDGHLLGLYEEADVSKYDTISIPTSVKVIEANAFANRSFSTITTLIITPNVSVINNGAFAGLTSVKTLDLSNLTKDSIDFLSTSGVIVDSKANTRKPTVKMPNVSEESKDLLIKKLVNAGVPEDWFVETTEGHVSIDETKKQVTTVGTKAVQTEITLNETPYDGDEFKITIEKTGGTDGTLVDLVSYKVVEKAVTTNADEEEYTYSLQMNTKLNSVEGHVLAEGEEAIYNVTVTCTNPNFEPATRWVQTITDFKLTYSDNGVVHVSSIAMSDSAFVVVGSTLKPTVTVTPSNAFNKTLDYSWYSNDGGEITIEDGVITGKTVGTIVLTATSKDNTAATATMYLTVVEPTEDDILNQLFVFNYHEKETIVDEDYYYITRRDISATASPETLVIPSLYDDGTHGKLPVKIIDTNESYGIFEEFIYLKTIVLPNTITSIPRYAFRGCTSLKKVYIPDDAKLEYIGYEAFYYCPSLTELTLPETVTEICFGAFWNTGLPYTYDSDTCIYYYTLNGNSHYFADCFIPERTGTYKLVFHKDTHIIAQYFLPYCYYEDEGYYGSNVVISKIDFSLCTQLTSIGYCAFSYEDEVATRIPYAYHDLITATEITLPSSLKHLGARAFLNPYYENNRVWYDNSIKTINLNEGLEYIGEGAFYGLQNITEITIPSTVKQIGHLYARAYVTLDDEGEEELGRLDDPIPSFSSESTEDDYVGAFECCFNLEHVEFAVDAETGKSQLETLGLWTFTWTGLTSTEENPFVLPDSIKRLDMGSIALCSYEDGNYVPNIEQITIPASVEYMHCPFNIEYDAGAWAIRSPWRTEVDEPIVFEDTSSTWSAYSYSSPESPVRKSYKLSYYDWDYLGSLIAGEPYYFWYKD